MGAGLASRTREDVATRRVTHLFTVFPESASVSRPRRVEKEAASGPTAGEGPGHRASGASTGDSGELTGGRRGETSPLSPLSRPLESTGAH